MTIFSININFYYLTMKLAVFATLVATTAAFSVKQADFGKVRKSV
jgi:hypothetical protein